MPWKFLSNCGRASSVNFSSPRPWKNLENFFQLYLIRIITCDSTCFCSNKIFNDCLDFSSFFMFPSVSDKISPSSPFSSFLGEQISSDLFSFFLSFACFDIVSDCASFKPGADFLPLCSLWIKIILLRRLRKLSLPWSRI